MALALIVSLLAAAPSGAAAHAIRSDDPPVKVWLNHDNYFVRGDKARVNVRLADDGYLVVLRADAQGRVRALFPLDPSDDDFARGGKSIEIRGRGDREAFAVDDGEGSGVVLAARSVAPFKFDEFVRGDHWDYRILTARDAGDDKEQALLDVVQRMVPDGHFDYDAVTYTVASPRSYYRGYDPYYSSMGIRLGFGYGWPYYRYGFAYSSCFDPFFYDPFFCSASFYDPFFYDPFFYGYRRYAYGPFFYPGGLVIYNRQRYGGGLFIDRVRRGAGGGGGGGLVFKDRFAGAPTTMGVEPRLRIPQGTLLNRSAQSRAVPLSAPARTPVRTRDPWTDGSAPPARARGEPGERRAPEARGSAPGRGEGGRGQDRPAASAPRRDRPSGGGGGGGRSPSGGRGASSGSSGGSRGSAPSHGGGRRRP